MGRIFFKLENTITDLIIPQQDILTFNKDGAHSVKLILRAPTEEEQTEGFKISNAMSIATSTNEVNPKVFEIFNQIASNTIITHTTSTHFSVEYTTPEGLRIRLPVLNEFPQNFQSCLQNTNDELWDFTKRSVSTLRWRANLPGKHNPFGSGGLKWSFNGVYWHHTPHNYQGYASVIPNLHISEKTAREIQAFINAGGSEPIYHDLFREAWEHRIKNSRSALVIGIAAAELSVKHCISILIPDSKWLVTNLPTPPIKRILQDYIPSLPTRNDINGKVKPPPDRILKSLESGINIRNGLSHAGEVNPNIDKVIEILNSVHDILWLMDYYSGNKWAFGYISDETKRDLLKN